VANGKGRIIAAGLGAVAVIWLALRIAPAMEQGLDAVLRETGILFAAPFDIAWCGSSLRTLALFLLLYGVLLAVWLNDDPNRRPMEEHGSAKWGSPGALNKKYAHPVPTANKQLTRHVAIGLDGRIHRRNLNVVCIGGSGAGKTRFFAKVNVANANTSFVILDPKGENNL
jgi:type IV secretion system protein VirD4